MEECSSRSTLVDSLTQAKEDYSSRSTLIESSAQTMEECSSRSTLVELSAQINEYEAADVNVVNEWEKELMDDISEEVQQIVDAGPCTATNIKDIETDQ
jgi:hypothetical protein